MLNCFFKKDKCQFFPRFWPIQIFYFIFRILLYTSLIMIYHMFNYYYFYLIFSFLTQMFYNESKKNVWHVETKVLANLFQIGCECKNEERAGSIFLGELVPFFGEAKRVTLAIYMYIHSQESETVRQIVNYIIFIFSHSFT